MRSSKEGLTVVQRLRLFQKAMVGIAVLFGVIMVLVTIIAFSRESGATKMDIVEFHKLRNHSIQTKEIAEKKDTHRYP